MKSSNVNPVSAQQSIPGRWLWRGVLLALFCWVIVDLFVPSRSSLRQFDPNEVARLETAMWRSYYEKKPVRLFWQLATGLRQQFHAPFWRSFWLGYQATKAAFIFKQGGFARSGSERALPDLVTYYKSIQQLSVESFNVADVARLELEWWIIHRQRNRYSYEELAKALENTAAALYTQPSDSFTTYSQLRADAMRLCDNAQAQPGGATDTDWQRIDDRLSVAWQSFHQAVQRKHTNLHVSSVENQ